MSTSKVILVGNGGHAQEVAWLCSESTDPLECIGYLDDVAPTADSITSLPYLGNIARAADYRDAWFTVAIGAPRVRARLTAILIEHGVTRFPRLIHHSATIGGSSELAAGVQVFPGVRITTNVRIGQHTILNQNCTIAHDCRLGDFVTVAPMAAISGNVTIGDGVEIGTGSSLHQGLRVDRGAMLGMGAVAIRDVAENCLVVGNPARALRQLEPYG